MQTLPPRKLGAPAIVLLALTACTAAVDTPDSPTGSQNDAFTTDKFHESEPGNGTYEIRGIGDKCLDVGGAPFLAGDAVTLYGCNGSIAQQIRLVETAPLSFVYTMQAGDKCIAPLGANIRSGTTLVLAVCNGSDAQQWRTEKETMSHVSFTSNANAAMVIDVRGGQTANLTPIQLNNKQSSAPSQAWSANLLEIAGAVPRSPRVRESRATVRDHRGGVDTTTTVPTFEYEDRSTIETGYTFWMKSYGPAWTDARPWTQFGSAPSVASTGTTRLILPPVEKGRIYLVAARAVNAAGASTPGWAWINALPPEPVEHPSISDVSSTSMILHWEGQQTERVDGYRVRYGTKMIDLRAYSPHIYMKQTSIDGLTAGATYCFKIASYNDLWGESAPITQCGTTAMESPPPPPPPPPPQSIDLVATYPGTSPTEFPTVNDSLTFSWTECNAGGLDAGSHQWVMYVEPENGGSYTAGSGTVSSLRAGACINKSVDVGFLPIGRFTLQVLVDPANAIAESSESNNQTSDTLAVSAPF